MDLEARRSTATFRTADGVALVGSAAAAASLTWIVFERVAPFSGLLGFVVVAYGVFLACYGANVALTERGPAVRDRLAAAVVQSLAGLVIGVLAFVVGYTFWSGWHALVHWNFFTQDLSDESPADPLSVGGVLHAMVGTLEQIALALAFTLPLGVACAVFLSEVSGGFSRFVRTVVEAMTALPSIVAGLFVYAALLVGFGVPKSGFAASVAIGIMMLPIIIRTADVILRVVPGSLREASYALGAGQWRTVWHVVLPTARSGLATALILGTARGIGETSPVLLTAGYAKGLNGDPFHGPQVSLPLLTFKLVTSPVHNEISRGFGAAAVLMVVVLLIFLLGRLVGGRGPGQLTPGQARRRAERSRRDHERITRRLGIAPPDET